MVGTVTGAGNPTFAAGRARRRQRDPRSCRLARAGASVIGKTITDELAFSLSGTNMHYGMPRNVNAPGRVPGGSSAGSAAAIAAGLADLALGTDTGGSVRIPASYCGIYGWRPTHGAVPSDGVVPLAPSFDVVGLFATNADLLLHGADALLSPPVERADWSAPRVQPGARRRGAARLGRRCGGDHRAGRSAARRRCRPRARHRPRCRSHRVPPPPGSRVVGGARRWISSAKPRLGAGVAARFAAASKVTDDEVAEAERGARRRARRGVRGDV